MVRWTDTGSFDEVCPVCAAPDDGRERCAGCGWEMHGEPVLGELTESDRAAARAALDAAGHAWDARAAARSRTDDGDVALLASVLRAGPAEPGEPLPAPSGEPLAAPESAARGAAAPRGYDSPAWQQIVADLVGGRVDALVFVEFSAEGVSVVKATVDGSGIPRQADAGSAEWGALAPVLDSRPGARRFQLAGGLGTLPVARRTDFDAAVTRWLRSRMGDGGATPAAGHPIVLVDRHAGWVLLERAVAALRAAYPPRAELGPGPADPSGSGTRRPADTTRSAHPADTSDVVREALRTAPLRVDHTLLLAQVDRRTGTVRAHSHVLFPAGSRVRPGRPTTVEITVHGGLADRPPLLLPVLAGRPAVDGTGAVLLSARQAALRAFAPARLTFELRGPGDVTLSQPLGQPAAQPPNGASSATTHRTPHPRDDPGNRRAKAKADAQADAEAHAAAKARANAPATTHRHPTDTSDTSATLPDLITRLPRRVIRPPALEVFLTVEMSGAERAGDAAERLAFAKDVIEALARRHGASHGVRVGVVGHYDHVIRENDFTPRTILLRTIAAGPAQTALTALDSWQPGTREQDTVSSLEDALKAVVPLAIRQGGGPRQHGVQRVVLIVGRRPPGLPAQAGVVPSCPLGVDWRQELTTLRSRGVRVMARADPVEQTGPQLHDIWSPAQHHSAAAWAELRADGCFHPGTDTADRVAEALAPPWRWDGPPCRLAFAAPLPFTHR